MYVLSESGQREPKGAQGGQKRRTLSWTPTRAIRTLGLLQQAWRRIRKYYVAFLFTLIMIEMQVFT